MLQEFARYRRSVQQLHALGPAVQEGVSPVTTLSSSELTRASSCPSIRRRALHAGAVRSSAVSVWSVGDALRRGGSEVEPNAVGGGVW